MTTAASIDIAELALFDLTNEAPGQFLRIKRTMIDISHVIEDVAAHAAMPCCLFAGFQRLSLFAKEAERYARLAQHYNGCWIFGVADVELPVIPGITAVALPPHSPLTQEWFVVADGPTFGTALLTADTNGFAIADASRRFMGIWTADRDIVRAASVRLSQAVGVNEPTWPISDAGTLHGYEQMTNHLLAIHEERATTKRSRG